MKDKIMTTRERSVTKSVLTGLSVPIVALLTARLLFATVACTKPEARSVEDFAFRAADIACIFGSTSMSPEALAEFCRFEKPLSPIARDAVTNMIGVREGARGAGVMWRSADAGSLQPERERDKNKKDAAP